MRRSNSRLGSNRRYGSENNLQLQNNRNRVMRKKIAAARSIEKQKLADRHREFNTPQHVIVHHNYYYQPLYPYYYYNGYYYGQYNRRYYDNREEYKAVPLFNRINNSILINSKSIKINDKTISKNGNIPPKSHYKIININLSDIFVETNIEKYNFNGVKEDLNYDEFIKTDILNKMTWFVIEDSDGKYYIQNIKFVKKSSSGWNIILTIIIILVVIFLIWLIWSRSSNYQINDICDIDHVDYHPSICNYDECNLDQNLCVLPDINYPKKCDPCYEDVWYNKELCENIIYNCQEKGIPHYSQINQ